MSKNNFTPINLSSFTNANSLSKNLIGPKGINPKSGQVICGDVGISIDRNGNWHHHGSLIVRIELVRLFASVLQRDDDGYYWLITPAEMAKIEVEDAPFLAVELFKTGSGTKQTLSLRTNLNAMIDVDAKHPIRIDINSNSGEPSPYVVLDGNVEAKISRSVYYELVSLSVKKNHESKIFGVWSKDVFFSLGSLGIES